MIDVVCFCGRSYSFTNDVGVCPKCGERVSLNRGYAVEEHKGREEPAPRLSRLAEKASPEEIAA